IHREFGERMTMETQVRDYLDNSYFSAHLGRLVGHGGMPGAFPHLRHWFPSPRNWHNRRVPNVKSPLAFKIFFRPNKFSEPAPVAQATEEARSKVTSMARNLHEGASEQRAGSYKQFFHSSKINAQVAAGGTTLGVPGPQGRFAIVSSNEK